MHAHGDAATTLSNLRLAGVIFMGVALALSLWAGICVITFWSKPITVMSQRKYLVALITCTIIFTFGNLFWINQTDAPAGSTVTCWLSPLTIFPTIMGAIALLTVKEFRVLRLIQATSKFKLQKNNDKPLIAYVVTAFVVPVFVTLIFNGISRPVVQAIPFSDAKENGQNNVNLMRCAPTTGLNPYLLSLVLDTLTLLMSFALIFVSFKARKIPTIVGESKYMFVFCIITVPALMMREAVTIYEVVTDDEKSSPHAYVAFAFAQALIVFIVVTTLLVILVFRKYPYLDTSADDLRKRLLDHAAGLNKDDAKKIDSRYKELEVDETMGSDYFHSAESDDNEEVVGLLESENKIE
ncbi:Hypothetical Protein FCC1311_001342 [Hondaea fermentalgiana]|uniref:G-protein coupled receptors family 3 profile domain-containing protein n=1 Tax=Hondaea fermentalgiana TaxID=2315210 RepID=A0A2R5G064_9STRA|nr:Hypothetical Protein FCC1311_001342 [Hondaea fermentalgiana]|eukprot:GBG23915.1 Hypothetical Protein FCC1311_001342 [Hondaea fermentalgiana]